jgi:hypothetical protein
MVMPSTAAQAILRISPYGVENIESFHVGFVLAKCCLSYFSFSFARFELFDLAGHTPIPLDAADGSFDLLWVNIGLRAPARKPRGDAAPRVIAFRTPP